MNPKNIFLMFFFFLAIFITLPIQADYFEIKAEEVIAQGVNYDILDPINLTANGNAFIACERIKDISLKTKGYVYRLIIFRFADRKLDRIDKVDIPVTQWVNGAVGSGKRSDDVMIIGNYGTKIVRVNLKTLEVCTLFEHQKGKPGLKAGPLLGCYKDDFYATGWAYDHEQYWQGDYLIKLQEDKKEKLDFSSVRGLNFQELFKDELVKAYYYISHEQVLYNVMYPKEKITSLKFYDKGRVTTIDSAYQLQIFIGAEGKIFYSTIDKEGKAGVLRHYLVDVKEGKVTKKQQIGEDNDPFTYPFFSSNGDVLVVIKLAPPGQILSAYYGESKRGYALIKFMHNVEPGPMKLSADGKTFLYMNRQGMRVYSLGVKKDSKEKSKQ